ncbi:MAG: hypothetical protein OEV91_11185 [Desulfobulbaceae bacterium]|nr:hypothetical protein [Desulfobulbaceae bacterium]HIJ91765.1 hypothetical protein [Deltaproteobacteria bacterium]
MHHAVAKRVHPARPAPFLLGVFLLFFCSLVIFPPHLFAQGEVETGGLASLKKKQVTVRGENLAVAMLLQSLGKVSGVNIYVADDITETINIDLEDISMYDLFMVVTNSKNLHYSQKNNVIYVEKKGVPSAITTQICPENGTAFDYAAQLRPLLSPKGVLTFSERSNCLIVQDSEEVLVRIKTILSNLDTPLSQVHIKASIVAVSKEAERQLGIKWGYNNYRDSITKGVKNKTVTATAGSVNATPGNLRLIFGMLQDNLDLDVELNALQTDGLAMVLSSPQVLVLDGKQASIKQGQEVSYVATSGDIVNTSFKEANLSLEVTPKIQGKLIAMKVKVNNDNVDTTSKTGEPLINTQEISTDLLIRDGVTAVIGGIILQSDSDDKDRVPGLSDIPLLGNLFKSSEKKNERHELLVFITANIVSLNDSLPMPEHTSQYLEENGRTKLLAGEGLAPAGVAEK